MVKGLVQLFAQRVEILLTLTSLDLQKCEEDVNR